MTNRTVVCTNCSLPMDDPGASGNRCPRCKNGGMVPEGSDML